MGFVPSRLDRGNETPFIDFSFLSYVKSPENDDCGHAAFVLRGSQSDIVGTAYINDKSSPDYAVDSVLPVAVENVTRAPATQCKTAHGAASFSSSS